MSITRRRKVSQEAFLFCIKIPLTLIRHIAFYYLSQFCPEKYDAFIFFHTISVMMNRLTLQPKGEGCLTTHQSHCNRLVFCRPIELHRYKAYDCGVIAAGAFCRPIELHRYKAQREQLPDMISFANL